MAVDFTPNGKIQSILEDYGWSIDSSYETEDGLYAFDLLNEAVIPDQQFMLTVTVDPQQSGLNKQFAYCMLDVVETISSDDLKENLAAYRREDGKPTARDGQDAKLVKKNFDDTAHELVDASDRAEIKKKFNELLKYLPEDGYWHTDGSSIVVEGESSALTVADFLSTLLDMPTEVERDDYAFYIVPGNPNASQDGREPEPEPEEEPPAKPRGPIRF